GRSRMTVTAVAMIVTLTTMTAVAACGSGSKTSKRPATSARLEIVSPTASEVTGPNVTLKFNLIGATVLPPAQVTGPLRGDQGHIHVRLDGTGVQMSYGTELPLTNLSAGPH